MKVAIQTYKNTGHQGRGIGVYGEELMNEIKKTEDIDIQEFSEVNEITEVDLIHFLHFDLFQNTLPSKIKAPFIVTIHDLTPLMFPKQYPAGIKGRVNFFWQKKAVQKAKKIITISDASKKDIQQKLGIPKEKIKVVYSGVSKRFKKIENKSELADVKKKFNLPDQYAFYSGNVNWNKNILTMAQSCIDLNLDLVIVGKSFETRENLEHPEMQSYKQFIEKYATHPKIHILGYVSDKEMVSLLNLASVALFLSFYEGFGFPILEAQACEVPVITSNCSSMPEIGGFGALYVDPYSLKSVKNGISAVLDDKKLQQDLIKNGIENVSKFSWQKCAQKTIETYYEILQ